VSLWLTAMSEIEDLERLSAGILTSAEADRAYLADLTSRLIKIPTPSSHEKEAVDLVGRQMEALGPEEVFVDSMGSVVARLGRGDRVILYDSHLDTVGVGDRSSWTFDPYGGILDGGAIHGRGASDNKAGMACMVGGVKILSGLAARAGFTLYVVGIVQEEVCEGLALRTLMEEHGIEPELVVLGECTNLGISRGHRGRAEIEVVTKGASCHASAPSRGENAIYRMTSIIEGVKMMQDNLAGDPFLGKGSIAVTSIDCSTPSRNAIPDSCRIFVDRRTVPSDTRDSVMREIEKISRFTGGSVNITTYREPSYKGLVRETEKFFPAWATESDSDAVLSARAACRLLFGKEPEVGRWDFSTDGNYSMGVRGIPTIGMGPGEERHAHTADDQVRVADLPSAAAFYALLPFVYCAQVGRIERID
jgi:putative selenium metabolism hydrolase